MKKIIVLISLLFTTNIVVSQISEQTKNKIKVKFIRANESYKSGNYRDALASIGEIESLLGGTKNPTAQNLKVKSLIGAGEYKTAKKELNILYKLNPSSGILQDIASYEDKINSGIQAEIRRKENARQAEIKRKEKQREKRRSDSIQRQTWLKREKKLKSDEIKLKNELKHFIINEYQSFKEKYQINSSLFIVDNQKRERIYNKYVTVVNNVDGIKPSIKERYTLLDFQKYDFKVKNITLIEKNGTKDYKRKVYSISFDNFEFNNGNLVLYSKDKVKYRRYLNNKFDTINKFVLLNLETKKGVIGWDKLHVYENGNFIIGELYEDYLYSSQRMINLSLYDKDLKRILPSMRTFYDGNKDYHAYIRGRYFVNTISGFIDKEGNIIFEFDADASSLKLLLNNRKTSNYDDPYGVAHHVFSEGVVAMFNTETNKCGYLNLKGQIVIPFNYYSCQKANNGVVKVKKRKKSKKYFTLNLKGEKVKR